MSTPLITYQGDGVTKQFNIPFPYLRREHIFVSVDDIPASFGWINDSRIECLAIPALDAEITIKRRTPANPLHILQDNRPLPAKNFMELALQAIYLAQEIEAGTGSGGNSGNSGGGGDNGGNGGGGNGGGGDNGGNGGGGNGGGGGWGINFDPTLFLEKAGGTITGDLTVDGVLSTNNHLKVNMAGFYANGNIVGSIWEAWGSGGAFAAIDARIEARANAIAEAKVNAAINAFRHNPEFTGTLKCTGNIEAYSS